MKRKFSKILGVALTFVLVVSMFAFAIPAAADPDENEWSEFAYPVEGSAGDWFRDAGITAVGPMAQAINGDLYAYAEVDSADKLFKSEDGGRTWAESTATHAYNGGAIVDMVCSSMDEDILYVTDGNYVYKSADAGDTFAKVAAGSLEKILMGTCGTPVTGTPITSLDVGYDASDNPFVFIGVRYTYAGPPSVLYIEEMAYPSEWGDLELDCYGEGGYTPYSVGAAPDFADSKKTYAVVSSIASLSSSAEWDIMAGRYSAKLNFVDAHVYVDITNPPPGYTIADLDAAAVADFGFWYYQTAQANFGPQLELKFENPSNAAYIDITFMLQTNTTLNQWTEVNIGSTFGNVGTWDGTTSTDYADLDAALLGMGGACDTFELTRVRVELYHDYVGMPGRTCYIDDVTIDGVTYALPGETHVISTTGTPCVWTEVSELLKDNNLANSFAITDASRIAFPDDYEDTDTLFVGVVDSTTVGGDVYSVTKPDALDLDVAGSGKNTNICSLDIIGDTEEASLIAGQDGGTNVYYSTDGGWTWDISAKDPTGDKTTYALWVGDSALAATTGTECAVSMSCGEEVGEYFNQISLIATDISSVVDISHSPGYITDSETLFMLTSDGSASLYRYDQTYWERVFSEQTYGSSIEMVRVSPDFNTTDTLYVGNTGFDIWRSTDAGCSWTELRYSPNTATMNSAVVIDEDTVIAGGAGYVYKTTRHGARPWDDYKVTGAGNILSFAVDGDTILLGDNSGKVFLSEDAGETWDLVGDCATVLGTGDTSLVFDPGYADNLTIYAAAGNVIARCVIDPDAAWGDQEWKAIYTPPAHPSGAALDAWGIVAAGDTALYVADQTVVETKTESEHDDYTNGGVLRSLNPDADKAADVVFETITVGLEDSTTKLDRLWLTVGSNVLWSLDSAVKTNIWTYEDLLATPVLLDSPSDGAKLGGATTVTLSWEELDKATLYQVSLYRYCAECPDRKELVSIVDTTVDTTKETCIVVGPLDTGTKYFWQVRVALGEPVLSKWSELWEFTTALGEVTDLCSPACGASDVILSTNFSWKAVSGAGSYEVEIATNEDFDPVIASGTPTVNAWAAAPELDYSTTYYWRVRAVKDGVVGAWSVCIFTTEGPPVVPPEPLPPVEIPPLPAPITPAWIWAIIGIGAALVIAVIVLIVSTRRVP